MRLLLTLLLLPILAFAQEFQFRQEYDTIPIEINGWTPFASFTGGESETAPELCDIDADGDFDFFVGNWGYSLTYFENIGTNSVPQFKFRTKRYDGITIDSVTAGRTFPVFCDLDVDGDKDLILGDFDGRIHYWRNDGSPQSPSFTLITDSLQNIVVSGFCKPELWDCDDDGDLDLFIGDYWGKIAFYRNIGTPQQYNFSYVSDFWLNIDVGFNSCPKFIDIDADDDEDLFVGAENGKIWFYRNDGDSANYNFTYMTNNYNSIDVGNYATPEFVDIDHDEDYDLYVGREGHYSVTGDIYFFQNIGTAQSPIWNLITEDYLAFDMGGSIRTRYVDIDADSDEDLFISLTYPSFFFCFSNVGNSQQASYHLVTNNYQNIHENNGCPDFVDIDADGDYDLFMGEGLIPNPPFPGLNFYQNIGTPRNANFSLISSNYIPYPFVACIRPFFADIDDDGDADLFVTDNSLGDSLYYIQNIGTASNPVFVNPVTNWQGLNSVEPKELVFYDIDNDGDLDLFIGRGSPANQVWFFRNIGDSTSPNFELVTTTFLTPDFPFYPGDLNIRDIDNDGDGDFLIGTFSGGILFFRNITGDSVGVKPHSKPPIPAKPTLSLFPNPSNAGAVVRFTLPGAGLVRVELFDVEGRAVRATHASPLQGTWFPAGTHDLRLDAKNLPSGVYLIRLETPQQRITQKMVILK